MERRQRHRGAALFLWHHWRAEGYAHTHITHRATLSIQCKHTQANIRMRTSRCCPIPLASLEPRRVWTHHTHMHTHTHAHRRAARTDTRTHRHAQHSAAKQTRTRSHALINIAELSAMPHRCDADAQEHCGESTADDHRCQRTQRHRVCCVAFLPRTYALSSFWIDDVCQVKVNAIRVYS